MIIQCNKFSRLEDREKHYGQQLILYLLGKDENNLKWDDATYEDWFKEVESNVMENMKKVDFDELLNHVIVSSPLKIRGGGVVPIFEI